MGTTDIFILTVYFISIFYVLYQAFNSLEDRITITLDSEASKVALETQLERCRLENQLDIKIQPQGPRPLGSLDELKVNIQNNYADVQIYIDWDRSSLTRPTPGPKKTTLLLAQRVIHLIPTMTLDLFQNQASSVVNPGEKLSASVATEDVLSRNQENQIIERVKPVIESLEKLAGAKEEIHQKYSLNLVLHLKQLTEQTDEIVRILLPYTFTVGMLAGKESLPFVGLLKGLEQFWASIQPLINITLIFIVLILMLVLT